MTIVCAACGRPLAPGEALLVIGLVTSRRQYVHRPSIRHECFATAGSRYLTAIALVDEQAARRLDAGSSLKSHYLEV